jgi:serine/threonine-protein kinase RsbW
MLDVTLAGGREAPAQARAALLGLNGSLVDLRASVRLLVSELVSNAVRHAGTDEDRTVRVRLDATPERVHVDVIDEGPGFEPGPHAIRDGDPLEAGFGLALVDELADRWGVEAEGGACVWFEIDR